MWAFLALACLTTFCRACGESRSFLVGRAHRALHELAPLELGGPLPAEGSFETLVLLVQLGRLPPRERQQEDVQDEEACRKGEQHAPEETANRPGHHRVVG